MASFIVIEVQRLMTIDAGFQAILRFYISNLNSPNVGNTDRRDLRCSPLRSGEVA
jgi:hypothetical protein